MKRSSSDAYDLTNRRDDHEFVFRTYYARLCYYAEKFLPGKAEAEDVVQDTFVKIFSASRSFGQESDRKRYLYAMVRNACLNYLRHNKVAQKFVAHQSPGEADHEHILQYIIDAEVTAALYSAVAALPEGCRTVFELGYLEGLSNQEIADQLQVSINTVKTQKARALQLLRLKLTDRLWLALLFILAR